MIDMWRVSKMVDYKEMYLIMVRAARDAEKAHKQADQILIDAMKKCEEMYINSEGYENKIIYIGASENDTKSE